MNRHNASSGEIGATQQKLAWAIDASQGQFKLILTRCNYGEVRDRVLHQLQEQLQEQNAIELQVITLHPATRNLYGTMRQALGDAQPGALAIQGLEAAIDLDGLLSAANQVREEFRKQFRFPVLIWLCDRVFQQLLQSAPDFESWATTVQFKIAPDELAALIEQQAEGFFANRLPLTASDALELDTTLTAAQQDLSDFDPSSNVALQANLDALIGYGKQAIYECDRVQSTQLDSTQLDAAIRHYQRSLAVWQQQDRPERQARILSQLAQCYALRAPADADRSHGDWQAAQQSVQQALNLWEQLQQPDAIADSLSQFSPILRDLGDWSALEALAQQTRDRHQAVNRPFELSQALTYLAEVALAQARWPDANRLAQESLDRLDAWATASQPADPHALWPRFILAQAQQRLGQPEAARRNLELACDRSDPLSDLTLHRQILTALHQLYFQQKDYRNAFYTQQARRRVEFQFGLRAFAGALPLQARPLQTRSLPVKQTAPDPALTASRAGQRLLVQREIAAAGRQQDIQHLMARLSRRDCKLIVLHGESGVGKSSLLSAGLIPTLENSFINAQEILPVKLRVYSHWRAALKERLTAALTERGIQLDPPTPNPSQSESPPPPSVLPLASSTSPPLASSAPEASLLERLRQCEGHHLRVVLIFDQFEEFFFVDSPDPERDQQFFDFLGRCLQILSVKAILALRQDYLHYLLPCNKLESFAIAGNDILSRNVLYELGPFSRAEARTVIQQLTERSHFRLEPALIDALVEELADAAGQISPIELQVVGAQLQAENIATLDAYCQCGTKEALVNRYLAAVTADCGQEHQDLANLVLYLLTDDQGMRPLRTRAELEADLKALAPDLTPDASQLDLVLDIFVGSGLVFFIQEAPADRYQLVHDYLVSFIRRQQESRIEELVAALAQERQQRQQAEIEREQAEQARQILATAHRKANRRVQIGSTILGMTLLAALAIGGWATQALQRAAKADRQVANAIQQVNDLEKTQRIAQQNEQIALTNQKRAEVIATQAKKDLAFAKAERDKVNQEAQQRIQTANRRVQLSRRQVLAAKRVQQQTEAKVRNAQISLQQARNNLQAAQEITRLERIGESTLQEFESSEIDALLSALQNGQRLQELLSNTYGDYPTANPLFVLNTILNKIRERNRLSGHQGKLYDATFSPDGQMILTAGEDGTARLWSIEGKQLIHLDGHNGSVWKAIFTPDGRHIATVEHGKILRIWNLSGKRLSEFDGPTGWILDLSFSPDGQYLATVGRGGILRIWNRSGQQITQIQSHKSLILSVDFSPNGKQVVTAGEDGKVRIWNWLAQEKQHEIELNLIANKVEFAPDGHALAVAGADGRVTIWNPSATNITSLEGYQGGVTDISFSADTEYLAASSTDGTIWIWNRQGNLVARLKGHRGEVSSVDFGIYNQRLVTTGEDGTARIWDLAEKKIPSIEIDGTVRNISFSPNGHYFAVARHDGIVQILDRSGHQLLKSKASESPIWDIDFSPDSKRFATVAHDGSVQVWGLSGQQLQLIEKNLAPSTLNPFVKVHFSLDSNYIIAARMDGEIQTWNSSGQNISKFKTSQIGITDMALSPNSQYIVVAGINGTIQLWDLSGQYLASWRVHQRGFTKISFSADSQHIATAGVDGTAKIWSLSGQRRTLLQAHQPGMTTVAFSPNGKRIATAGQDGVIYVWNLLGQRLAKFTNEKPILSLTFSPDGHSIVSTGGDKTIKIWRIRELSDFIAWGCTWLKDYMIHHPNLSTVCLPKS